MITGGKQRQASEHRAGPGPESFSPVSSPSCSLSLSDISKAAVTSRLSLLSGCRMVFQEGDFPRLLHCQYEVCTWNNLQCPPVSLLRCPPCLRSLKVSSGEIGSHSSLLSGAGDVDRSLVSAQCSEERVALKLPWHGAAFSWEPPHLEPCTHAT